jgi:hypothetical protein
MNSDFHDPNNHVPEVTPDDGWGGDEKTEQPAKRIPAKKAVRKSGASSNNFEVREVSPVAEVPAEETPSVSADSTEDSTVFEDPNNHVPKLTAVDDWGSEESSFLPKKRSADDRPAGFSAKPDDQNVKGIEIGLKEIDRARDEDVRGPVQRLEVLEHVPKSPVQEESALPRVVAKQVIEKVEIPTDQQAEEGWLGRTTEVETWGRQKSVQTRWIIISGAVLGIVVLGGVLALPHFGWKNERGVRTNFSNLQVVDAPMLEPTKVKTELGEGIEAKSKALVEAYATATNVDEVLPLVRDRERVEKMVRERWTPMEVPKNWHVPDESKWEILRNGDREYGFLTGLLPNITPFRFYIVQEGDKALLDWEATSGFSETSFADLSKRQGEGGIVRGFISPGDLYTFSLPEADYQCYRIVSADGESSVWGYAKRTEPVGEKMAEPFVPGIIPREILSEYAMTLKLAKGPADALANQWIITEMVHMEWLTP